MRNSECRPEWLYHPVEVGVIRDQYDISFYLVV